MNQPASNDQPAGFLGADISEFAFKRALLFLVMLGLFTRLVFFVEHAHSPSFGVPTLDQKYYDTVAKMLIAGDDLHELHGFRPLLYPLFLAACYKLGGAWGVDLALLLQHFLGIATGVIVALLGARIFRHRLAGVVGGALFLLAPLPLYFEGELLIEPGYIFLIFLGLWLHLRTTETSGARAAWLWLACGAMTVLAAQARANILIFLAIYPLFAAWRWWQTRARVALLPLLGCLGALAMMIPWGVINLKQADKFHLVTNAGGPNFYLGNHRGADGMFGMDVVTALSNLSRSNKISTAVANERYEDLVEVWAREEYSAAMRAQGRPTANDPKAISDYWTHRAVEEIKADPATWAKLLAKKTWLMFWNKEVPNNKDFAFLQQEFFWLRALPVSWIVLLALAPAGMWAAMRFKSRDGLFLLLAYAALYSAGNIAFFICDRYRYPIWPAMAVLAGGGAVAAWAMFRRRDWRGLALVGAGAGVMAAVSLPNWFEAKLPNFAQDYFFRSSAWYEKGNFAAALADIDRSVALDARNAGALQHRGNVLFALDRHAEAAAAYEEALRFIPGDSSAWNNLGAALESLGDNAAALRAFQRSTECQPPLPLAFLGIAFIQTRASLLDEAAAALDRLEQLQRAPCAAPLAARSVIERKRGNINQADTLARQANRLDAAAAAWAIERATKPPL